MMINAFWWPFKADTHKRVQSTITTVYYVILCLFINDVNRKLYHQILLFLFYFTCHTIVTLIVVYIFQNDTLNIISYHCLQTITSTFGFLILLLHWNFMIKDKRYMNFRERKHLCKNLQIWMRGNRFQSTYILDIVFSLKPSNLYMFDTTR